MKSAAPPLNLLRAVRMQLTAVDREQQSYSNVEDLETWITYEQEWQQEHLAAGFSEYSGGLAGARGGRAL